MRYFSKPERTLKRLNFNDSDCIVLAHDIYRLRRERRTWSEREHDQSTGRSGSGRGREKFLCEALSNFSFSVAAPNDTFGCFFYSSAALDILHFFMIDGAWIEPLSNLCSIDCVCPMFGEHQAVRTIPSPPSPLVRLQLPRFAAPSTYFDR